jgi:hypothetical protein
MQQANSYSATLLSFVAGFVCACSLLLPLRPQPLTASQAHSKRILEESECCACPPPSPPLVPFVAAVVPAEGHYSSFSGSIQVGGVDVAALDNITFVVIPRPGASAAPLTATYTKAYLEEKVAPHPARMQVPGAARRCTASRFCLLCPEARVCPTPTGTHRSRQLDHCCVCLWAVSGI